MLRMHILKQKEKHLQFQIKYLLIILYLVNLNHQTLSPFILILTIKFVFLYKFLSLYELLSLEELILIMTSKVIIY